MPKAENKFGEIGYTELEEGKREPVGAIICPKGNYCYPGHSDSERYYLKKMTSVS